MKRTMADVLRGADSLEEDIHQLVRERQQPMPPPIPQPRPLSEETQKLICKGMILSAEQCVKEATDAAAKYRDEAQEQYDQVVAWGKTLVSEVKKAATSIAVSHSNMIQSAQHFRAAMENNQPPAVPQQQQISHNGGYVKPEET